MKRAMIIVTICLITGVSVLTMLVLFLGQPSTTLADSGDPALGRAVLTNTILVSQTVGLYADISTTATFDGVLWHGNSVANVDGSGLVTISNAYNGSPLFINPNNWDYHIEVNSTAINKGITTETNSDIDGDLRLGIPDLGADEKIWHNYLPIISRF